MCYNQSEITAHSGKEKAMPIYESGEMYLETIYVLTRDRNDVRSIDVCEHMGYSKPSVSRAVNLLKSGGLIQIDKDGYITLTDAGLVIGQKIYDRHTLLSSLLVRLGVSEKTAAEDACKMEHAISDESFEAIKRYFAEHTDP
jgi:Mn-dependent DtxR family transcriptional regulator